MRNVETTNFYSTSQYKTLERVNNSGTTLEGSYKTIVDGRYYELEISDVNDLENSRKTFSGYAIVDGEAANNHEINSEEARANISTYAPAAVNAFGMGRDIVSLSQSIFDSYNVENCYNAAFTYGEATVDGSTTTTFAFDQYIADPMGRITLSTYSCTFVFDGDVVVGLNFSQSQYQEDQETYKWDTVWNTETNTFVEGAEPYNVVTNHYEFTYGDVVAEETPAYDVNDYGYEDFSLEFYTEMTRDWSTSTVTFSGKIEEGTEIETQTTIYAKLIADEQKPSDRLYATYKTDDGAYVNFSDAYGQSFGEFRFSKAGEQKVKLSTNLGIEKEYTFNVFAPAPEAIMVYDDLPTNVLLNETITLPECEIDPYNADQTYVWEVVEGTDCATIAYNEDMMAYELTAVAVGDVIIRAAVPNTEIAEEFEMTIIEPLSEEVMAAKLVERKWVFQNYEGLSILSLNEDNTGSVVFGEYGVQTVFAFNWEFDYENASLNLSNPNWTYDTENSWSKGSLFNANTPSSAHVDLAGRNVAFTFYADYGYGGEPSPQEYIFTPGKSFEEVKEIVVDQPYQSGLETDNFYMSLFVIFNSDGTGKFYSTKWDDTLMADVEDKVFATFTWSWDGENIVLNEDVTFSTTLTLWDYQTGDEYDLDVTFTISKTMYDLDTLTGSTFSFDFFYEGVKSTGVFNMY